YVAVVTCIFPEALICVTTSPTTRYPWLAFAVRKRGSPKYEPVLVLNWRPGALAPTDRVPFSILRRLRTGGGPGCGYRSALCSWSSSRTGIIPRTSAALTMLNAGAQYCRRRGPDHHGFTR